MSTGLVAALRSIQARCSSVGIPCGERDSERRGVADALTGCADGPLAGVLERGDHQRIANSFDNRTGITEFVGKTECRRSGGVRHRPGRLNPRRHHGQRRTQRVGLVDRIATDPAAIAQRGQDGVGGCLGQSEFAHHVGEPQPGCVGAGEQFDDVENPRSRG